MGPSRLESPWTAPGQLRASNRTSLGLNAPKNGPRLGCGLGKHVALDGRVVDRAYNRATVVFSTNLLWMMGHVGNSDGGMARSLAEINAYGSPARLDPGTEPSNS